jgi:hypothetical protein
MGCHGVDAGAASPAAGAGCAKRHAVRPEWDARRSVGLVWSQGAAPDPRYHSVTNGTIVSTLVLLMDAQPDHLGLAAPPAASWRHAVVVSGTQSASRSRVSCGRGGRPYRSCRICPQARLCARLTKTRAFRAKERMQESRESPMESRSIGLFPSRSQRARLSTPWSDAWLPIGRQIGVPIGTDAREQLESSWASNPLFHCLARWATLSPVPCTAGQRNPTDPCR